MRNGLKATISAIGLLALTGCASFSEEIEKVKDRISNTCDGYSIGKGKVDIFYKHGEVVDIKILKKGDKLIREISIPYETRNDCLNYLLSLDDINEENGSILVVYKKDGEIVRTLWLTFNKEKEIKKFRI